MHNTSTTSYQSIFQIKVNAKMKSKIKSIYKVHKCVYKKQ